MQADTLRPMPYESARREIKDGDTLLFAPRIRWWLPTDWLTLLICWGGGDDLWYLSFGAWLMTVGMVSTVPDAVSCAAVLAATALIFIRMWTHSCRHCHAAKAVWWLGQLMCVQETSLEGHFLALSELVRRWPGKIDVYRPAFRSDYFRKKCVRRMVLIARRPYGWRNLIRAALRHLPVVYRFLPKDGDDWETSKWPPFCSMAVSMADRAGGVDPCENKSDRLTEPTDLADSPHYQYMGTLTV